LTEIGLKPNLNKVEKIRILKPKKEKIAKNMKIT